MSQLVPHVCLYLIGILSLVCPNLLSAQDYYFEYTQESRDIYTDIIALKLDQAELKLTQAISKSPENLSHLHLRSYIDFFSLFISEEEDKFDRLLSNKDNSIRQFKKHLKNDNPYKRFVIAELQLHSAIARSKFGQLFRASREILSAYKGLSSNQEDFPEFIYNKKSLSVIHSLIETVTIPGLIKRFFGIDGSIELGLSEIEEVISYSNKNPEFVFHEEVDAIYLYILFYQANEKEKAISYMDHSRLDPTKSLLANFLIATMYQRSGLNKEALDILKSKPKGDEYAAFHYLRLQEGLSKLRANDPSSIKCFKDFVHNFQGRHYIKDAYQKLAWASLVFDENIPQYKYYMQLVDESGHDLVDSDKQAQKESESKKIPNITLLKARLYFDGGYYHKANSLLTQNAFLFMSPGDSKLEFNYRMGRISHALKNYHAALEYYEKTINSVDNKSSYFACNAALQAAFIYESQNKIPSAIEYFDRCLEMEPSSYKNSLHQKAKSGKQRLEIN